MREDRDVTDPVRTDPLERSILDLLDQRAASSSICPSDVARSVSPENWRPLMEPVREAARRLVEEGAVEITQRGTPIPPGPTKGPIRIRKPRREHRDEPRN